jgi:hypothetical protein
MAYYDYQSYYGYGPSRVEPADVRS